MEVGKHIETYDVPEPIVVPQWNPVKRDVPAEPQRETVPVAPEREPELVPVRRERNA